MVLSHYVIIVVQANYTFPFPIENIVWRYFYFTVLLRVNSQPNCNIVCSSSYSVLLVILMLRMLVLSYRSGLLIAVIFAYINKCLIQLNIRHTFWVSVPVPPPLIIVYNV